MFVCVEHEKDQKLGEDDEEFSSEEEEEEEEVDFLQEETEEVEKKTASRADFLSANEIRHLTAAFDTCDTLESGELLFPAFMRCLAVMGKKVTVDEARKFFDAMDADKSGCITLDEWIGFYAETMVRLVILCW